MQSWWLFDMDSINNITNIAKNAAIYTDFNQLTRLRADAANQEAGSEDAKKTTKNVATQIEALFFQMVLKSMREANSIGDDTVSDQTRFYQDMFDKQITLELSQNNKGNGTGLAAMIEQQISGVSGNEVIKTKELNDKVDSFSLIKNQIDRSFLNNQKEVKSEQE
ncbi:MAG: rod-binding protein [Gammaproteobacteria bacterium]|nr:rod-binding protein [Gammaproteobacteria bacterium]